MSYPVLGAYVIGATVRVLVNTKNNSTQAPIIIAGSPAISCYKAGNATQVTTGCAIDDDYDGVVGLAEVSVDTSSDGTFYAAGNDFFVVVTTGTVNSVSVVGQVVGMFSLVASATASANIVSINSTTVDGDGNATPWGPA